MSRWTFDDLAEHLSHCLQIEWDGGVRSGLLRYYDTRVFESIAGLIRPLRDYAFDGAHWKAWTCVVGCFTAP